MKFLKAIKSHKRIKRLIGAYLDGELDPKMTKILLFHISWCDGCREYMESEKVLLSSIVTSLGSDKMVKQVDLWGDIRDGIKGITREKGTKQLTPIFTRVLRPALVYNAAILIGITIGIFTETLTGIGVQDKFVAEDEISYIDYLGESPPNSLMTLYFGEGSEAQEENHE